MWALGTGHRVETGTYGGVILASTLTPWRNDAAFEAFRTQIAGHTLVAPPRLYDLYQLAKDLRDEPGDILEVGVWRGGSGCLLAAAGTSESGSTTVYLADTFTGVAKASDKDPIYRGGEHADTSEQIVRSLADRMKLTNVELLTGIFPDDTAAGIADRTFKLVHVDVDVYASAKQVTEWVWPRLAPGGVIVFDDYGTPTTGGVRTFVEEFRGTPQSRTFTSLNQHAFITRFAG